MNESEARLRSLVDRMLREAAAAERYLAGGKARFFDIRTPEFRDSVELRALHFVETGTRTGQSFRKANPSIPWDDIDQIRNDLVHEYPEVKAERVWKFVHDDLPSIVAKLKRARFPTDANK
ncbi:MAG TPA: HepT-like ribonuclease domain-containing protein [Thermoplasmata archaeon]|nr:HepT-like ribonuclease domain-containing protein [Thermoplasmata archaeon]